MWRTRALLALLLLVVVAGLVPLAYASPPDSLWWAGVYDGDDHDDVVGAIWSIAGVPEGTPILPDRPLRPVDVIDLLDSRSAPAAAIPSTLSRAPPVP